MVDNESWGFTSSIDANKNKIPKDVSPKLRLFKASKEKSLPTKTNLVLDETQSTHQGVIESANEDELAVGREPNEGNRRILIVHERFHTMPRPWVPDPAQPIVATRND